MDQLASLVQRLEMAVGRVESMSGPGGSAGGDVSGGAVSAFVEAFDVIVSGPVAQYLSLSQKIGGDVQKHAEMIKQGFSAGRQVLMKASSCQKPADVITSHDLLSSCLLSQAPKPGPYVKEMQDAAMFYTNRVLKDFKDKDKTHVDWVKAYLLIWTDLQTYIKQHHTTGLSWSKTGPVASASAAPPSAPAGCPPPPPPGPPPPADLGGPCPSGGDSGPDPRNALFAALNKGSDITTGLKHVSDDQKTHKNPGLRGQGAVRTGPKPFASPTPRPAASATPTQKLPPVLELDGKKWKVENQEDNQNLLINNTELKQVVYAFKCNKSTLTVKGKLNSIIIDNCKKTGLVFDDVVGIVEIINCKDVKIQVIGKVPTISINKTDGCHVYLSKDSLSCEIVSAKSSEMNILVPKGEEGDFAEFPVPEQFKTVWDGKKLATTATEIAG
uniref:CAP, adenylate cyclase-associated protein 1 (yeast) n=1 Tax=Labrus bergylta TaxID=56723 RepID=A0A3Q3F3S7_9LABR